MRLNNAVERDKSSLLLSLKNAREYSLRLAMKKQASHDSGKDE